MTYIGQTTNLLLRMNNHISEARSGISFCIFSSHVNQCGIHHNHLQEPNFKVYVFMSSSDSNSLIRYESRLFKDGHAALE